MLVISDMKHNKLKKEKRRKWVAYVSVVTYLWLVLVRYMLCRNKQLINTVTKKTVSCRLLTPQAPVRSHVAPCEISGGQSDIPPPRGLGLGTFPKVMFFRKSGSVGYGSTVTSCSVGARPEHQTRSHIYAAASGVSHLIVCDIIQYGLSQIWEWLLLRSSGTEQLVCRITFKYCRML